MKWMYLGIIIALCDCTPKRFDWDKACSLYKECPEDRFCLIQIGPDGEPFEYGQCVKYDED